MPCDSCDKKPKNNESCAFTKATVEINNPKQLSMFRKVVVPASMGDDIENPPKVGKYCNVILYYEANDQVYLYSSDGIPTRITVDIDELKAQIAAVRKDLTTETTERKDADQEIWTEIETIEASSDVVDVVGTYAELQAYDTSKLHDNDLIKVLQDETHDDAITYYRWNGSAFTYVGAEGPYYTATETDTLLGAKQDKIVLYADLGSYTINENDAYINTPNFRGFFRDLAKTTIVTGSELYNMFVNGNSVVVHCATDTWGTLERIFNLDEGAIFGAVVFSGGGFSTDKTFRFTISESTGEPVSESVPGYYNRLTQDQMQLTAGDGVIITDRTTTSSGVTHIQKVISATGGIVIYSPDIFSYRYLYSDRNMTDKITWSELSALTSQASSNGKNIYIKTPGDPDVLYEAVEFYGGDYELTVVGRSDTDFSFLHISPDQDSQTYDEYIITKTDIQNKLTAGSNITISGTTISATDTTYADFVGTDGQTAGTRGLVPAPAVTDAGEFLKADGTWATPPGTTYAAGTGIDITNSTIAVDTAVIQEKLTAGSNITINNNTISATDTTYSNFGGATSSVAGSAGLVPAPTTSDPDKYLRGDGTWSSIPATNNINTTDWNALWQ